MDDMTAFERQVAGEMLRRAGPVRRVDDAAIFAATTATQSPEWRFQSLFGAATFVVAGVVVALFGGFLLAGVMTQPRDDPMPAVGASASAATQTEVADPTARPESTTRSDILPGVSLVTEEVEPGVFRIISDGVRDLSWVPPVDRADGYELVSGRYGQAVAVADDGTPWFFRPDGYFALSGPTHPWVAEPGSGHVIRQGTLWTIREQGLWRVDHDREAVWTRVRAADGFSIDASGTIWALTGTRHGRTMTIARSEDGGATWTIRELPSPRSMDMPGASLWIDDDGTAWMVGGRGRMLRSAGSRWRDEDRFPGASRVEAEPGPDGTVWSYVESRVPDTDEDEPLGAPQAWVRSVDGERTAFGAPDLVPRLSNPHDGAGGRSAVAPDGSVWFTAHPEDASNCDGIARIDGIRVAHYLRGLCPWAFAIGGDGAVWVIAGADPWYEDNPPIETYLIRAEDAMADR